MYFYGKWSGADAAKAYGPAPHQRGAFAFGWERWEGGRRMKTKRDKRTNGVGIGPSSVNTVARGEPNVFDSQRCEHFRGNMLIPIDVGMEERFNDPTTSRKWRWQYAFSYVHGKDINK